MLDGFERWLMESPDLPGAHWSRLRVPPTGPADAPLMILSDVPDADDVADGRLFAGQHGKLLDAMLAAIKLSRDTIRIASLAPTAPAGGRIPASEFSALAAIARHHVALARPCTLLLMGRQSCAIMTGDVVNPRFGQHFLNQIGVTSAVYSMHHPRLLLKQPLLKRQSWDVLKQIRSRN